MVDADGVLEFDRGEGMEVRHNVVGDLGKEEGVSAEDLVGWVSIMTNAGDETRMLTALSLSSQRTSLLSSSSCKPIALTYSQMPITTSARSASSMSSVPARA